MLEEVTIKSSNVNQVHSQPNAECKLCNTTDIKNDKKKKLYQMSSWLNTIHNKP